MISASNRLQIDDALAEARSLGTDAEHAARLASLNHRQRDERDARNRQEALDLVSAAIAISKLGGNRFRERHLHEAAKRAYQTQWPLPWDWTDVLVRGLGCVRCLEDGSFEWVEPKRDSWRLKILG